jgi:hypothetical protein
MRYHVADSLKTVKYRTENIEEGRRKKEEGRRKKEEGRRKKEEGRRKKKEAVIAMVSAIKNVLTVCAVAIQ